MNRDLQGHFLTISTVGDRVQAFVPKPLPPTPPISWPSNLRQKYEEALLALGRLDSISLLLPDTPLFLYTYIRKEAVLSSMIEGTQSSLSDLLMFELEQEPGVPLEDVLEVSNYVAALNYGIKRMAEGMPISLRLLKEIHAVLLSRGRGQHQTPGEFRRSQNWIAGTRPGNAVYVPPPSNMVLECMGSLELFLHDQPEATPVLLKAALAHVQFETIHPFLDGNGRLGRLLITLLLGAHKALQEPWLYLSLYFKTYRKQYYELLNRVRFDGDWEAWLDFFCDAVIVTATQSVQSVRQLVDLSNKNREKISALGRAAYTTQQVHRLLLERPIASVNWLAEKSGISHPTVNKALNHLMKLGIVKEMTQQKRNRLFSYAEYIDIMNQGTELPDS